MRPGNTGVVAGRRYYSPGLGRWISRDPIGERGHRLSAAPGQRTRVLAVDGGHAYLALLNRPTGAVDALGEVAIADDVVILGSLVVLLSVVGGYLETPAGQQTMQDLAAAMAAAAQAIADGASDAMQRYSDMCSRLNDVVQAVKADTGALGKCRPAMSCGELRVRRSAWLAEAVARAHRDVLCWGGGDPGHQQAHAQAWINVGTCAGILACKSCP